MTSLTKKLRRRRHRRRPPAKPVEPTDRDVQMMKAIVDHDGFLSTVQLATLFFQPDLVRQLRWFGLDQTQVNQLLSSFEPSYLSERIALAKWLLKIYKQDHSSFTTLDPALQQIAVVDPATWLIQAIYQAYQPPDTFLARPVFASDFVSTACRKRLRLLYDGGLLERRDQAVKLSEGSQPLLWFITKHSRKLLARLQDRSVGQITFKSPDDIKDISIPHRLVTNDILIAATLAAKRLGYQIKLMRSEGTMRRLHGRASERITYFTDPRNPDLGQQEGTMTPDGYLWLHTGNDWHMFWEIDLGSETIESGSPELEDWVRKISRHVAYLEQRYPLAYSQAGKSLRICIVTTTQKRAEGLIDLVREVTPQHSHRFWSTALDQITPTYARFYDETILSGNIWFRGDKGGRYALIW
ncbi:MAG: replication-relaxation family protein [Chloroflexota bacterium]